jgi:hypothetical protein
MAFGISRQIGKMSRAVAGLLALISALTFSAPAPAQTNQQGLPIIPFNIVNHFNPNTPVYVYIRGQVETAIPNFPANSWVYVSDLAGDITLVPAIAPGTYVNLSVPLGSVATASLQFPKLINARIYVSFGNPVTVCCSGTAGNSPSDPAPWASDGSQNIYFDWAEATWDNTGNPTLGHTTRLGGNVTQVDMYGLSLLLTLNGQSTTMPGPETSIAGFTANRTTILNAYLSYGSPWQGLVQYNTVSPTIPMRIIAPYHGIPLGTFPSNVLDSYIGQVFSYYASGSSNSMTVTASCGNDGGIIHTFTGATSGGVLTFTDKSTQDPVDAITYPMPTTTIVYENNIVASPTPGTPLAQCLAGVITPKLGGAFVRTNLLVNSNLDACQTSQFYVNSPIQYFARIFHIYGYNGLAYSFGYDDSCSQSSYITVDDPGSMTITVAGTTATHDYNGDQMSDIAWRDGTSDIAAWLMSAGQILQSEAVGTVSGIWTMVGQRDFNGDGKADLLWSNTSGNIGMWFMNGTQILSTGNVGTLTTNWQIAGTGDFNNDGKGDILWTDGSGNYAVWLMNAAQVISSVALGNVPTTWSVAATGDFNGDGMSDLLWRDAAGDTSIWFMNGTAVEASAGIGNIPNSWSVAGTGDFNGDGLSDIIWRDTSGNTAVWLMSGAQVMSNLPVGLIPTTWSVVQTGDYNGDGTSDLLWRDSFGNTAIWFMSNGQVTSSASLGNIPTNWTVQSINAD